MKICEVLNLDDSPASDQPRKEDGPTGVRAGAG